MSLYSCRNLPRTLADAASKGWAVLGAAVSQQSVPVTKVSVDRPTLLVIGSEGFGLRTNVRRACTQLVQVDMAPGVSATDVDSLNVSVATGILLHTLLASADHAAAAGSGSGDQQPQQQ